MGLEQTLETAAERIREGLLRNEAQVKQAVILPVLRALGWDDTDPHEFRPEYSVDGRWVDYALLRHNSSRNHPLVFIEAKRLGSVDAGGEEQLFGYAVNRGVPFLVLTDGNRWDFYLSMADGDPADRRFYRLELQQDHKIPEYAKFLSRHLQKDLVVSGDARRNAEDLHQSNQELERARRAIPDIWRTLLTVPDDTLRDLLAEAVESECGTRPDLDDVEEFLKGVSVPGVPHAPRPPAPSPHPPQPPVGRRSNLVGFILDGERVDTRTAKDTLVQVVRRFSSRDPDFMERFCQRTKSRKINLVSRDPNTLRDDDPQLGAKHSRDLGNGWWLYSHASGDQIRKHIKTACDVAGVPLKLIER